jgi:hypothetical protein
VIAEAGEGGTVNPTFDFPAIEPCCSSLTTICYRDRHGFERGLRCSLGVAAQRVSVMGGRSFKFTTLLNLRSGAASTCCSSPPISSSLPTSRLSLSVRQAKLALPAPAIEAVAAAVAGVATGVGAPAEAPDGVVER